MKIHCSRTGTKAQVSRSRRAKPWLCPALALVLVPVLASCDAPSDANIGRAARGTRDAVKSTENAINQAQKQAGDMADQIGKDPKNATPPAPQKPATPTSEPASPGRRMTPASIPGVPGQPGNP